METITKTIPILSTTVHSGYGFISENGYYILGAAIAVLVMAYLIYALLKPEKF